MGASSKQTNVLLTGAAGFIGSRIARALLQDGCLITALVRPGGDRARLPPSPQIRVVEGDFHHPEHVSAALEWNVPDIMVHAAWHATPGTYLTDQGNIDDLQASLDLFRRVRGRGCPRIVGIGTCLEYDTDRGWLGEHAPLAPRSLYAAAKASLFLTATSWARESDVAFAWARLFFQYGPGENRCRLVPAVITSLLEGTTVPISSSEHVRDYLHVDDVADAVRAIALSPVEGPINVGSGIPIRVGDLVDLIVQQIGVSGLVEVVGRPDRADDPPFVCAVTERLQRELHWYPKIPLSRGLAETVEWWGGVLAARTGVGQCARV